MNEKKYKKIEQNNGTDPDLAAFKSARSAKRISTTGFSMIEMLVYLGILFFVTVFVVLSVLYVGFSYKKLKAEHAFASSAQTSFDRMVRAIRDAEEIDPLSTLGANPGALTIQPDNVTFYLDNGQLMFREGTTVVGPLTLPDVSVTSLIFREITTTHSEAVKIEATFEISTGDLTQQRSFSTTAVLRGSY